MFDETKIKILSEEEFITDFELDFPICMEKGIITITPRGPRITKEDFFKHVKLFGYWNEEYSDCYGYFPSMIENRLRTLNKRKEGIE